MENTNNRPSIDALKVRQWLDSWEDVEFDPTQHRRRPSPHFYTFSLSASALKRLTGVYHRGFQKGQAATEDLGIQRRHDQERSEEIRRFIGFGYPWSELSDAKRQSEDFRDLKKPGWLPTAIVVNILTREDERLGKHVDAEDLVHVEEISGSFARLHLPDGFDYSNGGEDWEPKTLYPFEVIDGQHRLWAVDVEKIPADFQLPVVAFYGLDISWQAYLFWTINIKPKRINPSLAFDLYPLLRSEEWLDKSEGHQIYRQSRAQELVETLWSHPLSPWRNRINMLGEGKPKGVVSQVAWINALMSSYLKRWQRIGSSIGGLYGSPVGSNERILPWNRAQQAAFLIFLGNTFEKAVQNSSDAWAQHLREQHSAKLFGSSDVAFTSQYALFNTDQGIQGLLRVTNDIFSLQAQQYGMETWEVDEVIDSTDEEYISSIVDSLGKHPVFSLVDLVVKRLSTYDWRASSTPNLTEEQRRHKAALRGAGGYREIRNDLLKHLSIGEDIVSESARIITSMAKTPASQ